MRWSWLVAPLALLAFAQASHAEIKTEMVKYKAGTVEAQGFVAYNPGAAGKRPGVLVIPEWWGLDDYPKMRAKELAEMGYVAFVADMYGNGQTTEDPKMAGKWSGELKAGDRKELRARCEAGLEQLKANPMVDPTRTAAIGFCFGGTTVLELARSGADVSAVVCFHGDLSTKLPAQPGQIKAKVLVCHGAEDKFESAEQIAAFQEEMRSAKVDWEMNYYANAVHAFTNPNADRHGIPGIAYNKEAAARSWRAMTDLFNETFGASAEKAAGQARR